MPMRESVSITQLTNRISSNLEQFPTDSTLTNSRIIQLELLYSQRASPLKIYIMNQLTFQLNILLWKQESALNHQFGISICKFMTDRP